MLPATTASIVYRMRGYDEMNGVSAEVRRYLQSEWNGDGTAVLMAITRTGRVTPARNPTPWAERVLRRVAGIVETLAAAFANPSRV